MNNKIKIVVSTIYFGLGIHKPDVRLVIQDSMFGSFDEYLQMMGRAGRDSLPAQCIIYYNPNDVFYLKNRETTDF